jgi:nitroreductase
MAKKPAKADFLALAKSRRTTYEFSEMPVREADIRKILEAGRWAPSVHNSQPWSFVVIKDKRTIGALLDNCYYGDFHTCPPLVVAVVANPPDHSLLKGKSGEFSMYPYLSISLPALNMAYEASSLGISSCIMLPFIGEANKLLKVKLGYEAVLAVGFGYERKGAFRKKRKRKSLAELIYKEYYGQRGRL